MTAPLVPPVQQWTVTDHDGRQHVFETALPAYAAAFESAWTDRPTTLTDPDGGSYLIVRQHPMIRLVAQREL